MLTNAILYHPVYIILIAVKSNKILGENQCTGICYGLSKYVKIGKRVDILR